MTERSMREERVPLAEVARRAGVSTATASRVLNNRVGVADANRVAVFRAAELLGYERRPRLKTAQADMVGLIVPELTNPIFPLIAQTMETALAARGYASVLCTQVAEGLHEDDYVRMLLQRRVAGIVFVSGMHANSEAEVDRYQELREQGVPLVFINGYVEGVDAPFVSNDDITGMDLAVRFLSDLGHRQIGLAIGPRRYVPVQRKIAGFGAALRAHVDQGLSGDRVEECIASAVFSIDGGQEATSVLLERGVTAVICGSDLMALGALREARLRGIHVPADLSVIGTDGLDLVEFCDPPLTTVAQPATQMARAAVQALLQEIHGDPAPRAEYVFRPSLTVRASTAPPRGLHPN